MRLSTIVSRRSAINSRLVVVALAALVVTAGASAQNSPTRIVSLVPALTDMLIAMGARPQLAAVSSYDDAADVRDLPKVGALLDPDVERIVALRPDLVLVYGSQLDLMTQLGRASIPFYEYRHGGLAHIMTTMRELGKRTGRGPQAERLATEIERRIETVRMRTASRPKLRTLLVFGREPRTLRGIYASGGRGFLHEMLEAAGGVNVFADMTSESVQASSEMILARAPDVILELRSKGISSSADRKAEIDPWTALASLPAVRNNRIYLLTGKSLVVPGPLTADGIELMMRTLHPELLK